MAKSVTLVGAIHDVLYSPAKWATFASDTFYKYYQEIVKATGSNLTLATRSEWGPPELKRQSAQDWTSYTFHAISCGDSIDGGDITTQIVFDELIRVVKDVSPICKLSCGDRFLIILNVHVQSAPDSLSLPITATYGPLVLSKGSPVHGIAP